jgi:hypothetical protein
VVQSDKATEPWRRRAERRACGAQAAGVGLYPIVTLQYRSITLYQVSYQIQ